MDDTEVWSAVDRRRRAIVDLLTGLAPGLFLLLTGRTAWAGHLHGPGADALRRAVAA
jgi:hypothetical protein